MIKLAAGKCVACRARELTLTDAELEFTDEIGVIAEEENYHPLIITQYGRVTVDWWKHKIGGLHKNDFIMAARTDELFESV